jgi:hypothetical protein
VVKERVYEPPGALPEPAETGAVTPPAPPEVEARLKNSLHLLAQADFDTAERFLERRFELEATVRQRLSARLAASLLAKMPNVRMSDFPSVEALLEAVVRLRSARPF